LALRTDSVLPLRGALIAAGLALMGAGCDAGDTSVGKSSGAGGATGSASTGTTGSNASTSSGSGTSGSSTATSSSGGGGPTTVASSSTSSTASSSSGVTAGALHVDGNNLVDNGKVVRLLGVDHSGSEYSCIQGNGFFDWGSPGVPSQAFVTNLVSWHVNAVRVPLNEDCWLNINGAPGQYSGSAYQTAITSYVSLLRQNGLYVIVDLHWNNGGSGQANGQQQMADADHAPDFWTGVANAFKSDQGVVFDLYNEPHDIAWSCWQNGGCQVNGWNVAGMNQLIAAVRATGATNVVMAGGVAYASDLSQWLANKPNDPLGNLAASFHTYNFTGCADQSCWSSQIQPVASAVPLITGELGENDCAHGYIDTYMTWADSVGISYMGWAYNADFNCGSGPGLISTWNGTPTAFGAGYQAHLATVNP
jgi:endoglucanase